MFFPEAVSRASIKTTACGKTCREKTEINNRRYPARPEIRDLSKDNKASEPKDKEFGGIERVPKAKKAARDEMDKMPTEADDNE